MSNEPVPGYNLGDESIPSAPISMEEFDRLKQTVMFTEEDEEQLRKASEILGPQVEEVVDVWYDFVADHDFLLHYYSTPDGEPIDDYLYRVRKRFEQWIRDTCNTPYDEDWLNYQFEIGRRHREKKNETDDVDAVQVIDLRYVIGFIYPITATVRDFLDDGEHSADEVDAMYHAWFKAVVLQVMLWSYPYVKDDDW
ncbi:protoglobin domain-containing protein [Natrialba aegyptia]|uniref:Globin-sensor domain-containing protein n=1 Tax=Natrialba aegyptia DSM 13077 TaxID=1227491 RepID=M0ARK5_9EURY|nr:protoglobin domain-containing protein [Natrialba aegyptia]ELY99993.1 hypothetical protein C480_19609 [Natrialba aegyptia DSM 13077]